MAASDRSATLSQIAEILGPLKGTPRFGGPDFGLPLPRRLDAKRE